MVFVIHDKTNLLVLPGATWLLPSTSAYPWSTKVTLALSKLHDLLTYLPLTLTIIASCSFALIAIFPREEIHMPCSTSKLTRRVMDGLAGPWMGHSQVCPGGVGESHGTGLGRHLGHVVKNMGLGIRQP